MPEKYVINVDLANVKFTDPNTDKTKTWVLGWGDAVEIEDPDNDITDDEIKINWTAFQKQPDGSVKPINVAGTIKTKPKQGLTKDAILLKAEDNDVLKVDFVDIQQGDGSVIETPAGKKILIDGGDNQLFARYLANRFRGSSDEDPCRVDCILVTHGDADHFLGLTEIFESETLERLEKEPWKRLFICPERVYHNGLVKRPGTIDKKSVPDKDLLGETVEFEDPETGEKVVVITELESNLIKVDPAKMNGPFKKWQNVLRAYDDRLRKIQKDSGEDETGIEFRRLEIGDNDAFDFVEDDIEIEVFAPILTEIDEESAGLRFLHTPPNSPRTDEEAMSLSDEEFRGALSASHTINGHSIVFMMRYGGFTFLFSGDLNDEAERTLTQLHNRNEINLQSDVFKVPHHGSHDFSGAFVQAVAPIVSVVSSGDESARKEYIHPRATLVGALGKNSRVEEPLIFITELVAFFQTEGWMRRQYQQLTEEGAAAVKRKEDVVDPGSKDFHDFYAFSRAAFGIVMVRTDGRRMLVYTNSALADSKEAYAFEIDEFGKPQKVAIRKV